MESQNRIRGAIYGLACTDALGGPAEFQWRGSFEPISRYRYNANFHLPPGTWTDDTSMTLCLAQALVADHGQFDVKTQLENYVRWRRNGYLSATGRCFDIGNATSIALLEWGRALDGLDADCPATTVEKLLATVQEKINEKLGGEQSCGNGSLMRTMPIALVFYSETEEKIDEYVARAGVVTHPHITCVQACQVYVRMICNILRHERGHEPVSKLGLFTILTDFSFRPGPLRLMVQKYNSLHDLANTESSDISSSGFVVHTLEAALWAFFSTNTFKEGALTVVNLGDDADTVGAIYGGLAGAYYGIDAVPKDWIMGLAAKYMIDEIVDGMVTVVSRQA